MHDDRPKAVILVDDEPMVTRALASFLELETPYRVLSFTDPHEALAVDHESENVYVVISDFMMPQMDGITFLKKMRDKHPQATRILLTGYADKENAIRAINEAGLYYYLEKPWDNEHLKLIIRNSVERSSLFIELDSRVSALEGANEQLLDIRQRLLQAFL
jgi:DNA-binding NtrC family response regulator